MKSYLLSTAAIVMFTLTALYLRNDNHLFGRKVIDVSTWKLDNVSFPIHRTYQSLNDVLRTKHIFEYYMIGANRFKT